MPKSTNLVLRGSRGNGGRKSTIPDSLILRDLACLDSKMERCRNVQNRAMAYRMHSLERFDFLSNEKE